MSQQQAAAEVRPAVPYIKLPASGEPYLEGYKCKSCGAVFMGARSVCAKCYARDQMEPVKLANSGKLYVYSVVHRNFPGVKVPFVSAIVDLDGGGHVKGNLINIDPDPDKIKMGMPVKVVFGDAGRSDKQGNKYISYFFEPANAK